MVVGKFGMVVKILPGQVMVDLSHQPGGWKYQAFFYHGFKKPPRAKGGRFFQFSLVRKMGIFLNRLVKPF